ncbi:MAG: hypothetical protein ACREMP_07970 [Candidatus Tyrphobacter sp.]
MFPVVHAAALASLPATSPSPSSVPSPTPSDPCGSILSIVNRPTIGTGVCTVRSGKFDIENGYTNAIATGPGGGYSVAYPQTLLRIGTANSRLDVEIGAPVYSVANFAGARTVGWSDLSVGTKYELGFDAKADWGVNVVATLPTGNTAFSAGHAQTSANFNWSYTLNAEFGLSGTVGANDFSGYDTAGNQRSYFALLPTIELSAALPGGPSQISAEYAYFSQAGPGLGAKSVADFVYARDFGARLQLDVEYGFSPTPVNGQRQHYFGAGLSFMN